nr:MAG TPA: hypothetical protein [Caudoviricetes sp.]
MSWLHSCTETEIPRWQSERKAGGGFFACMGKFPQIQR